MEYVKFQSRISINFNKLLKFNIYWLSYCYSSNVDTYSKNVTILKVFVVVPSTQSNISKKNRGLQDKLLDTTDTTH